MIGDPIAGRKSVAGSVGFTRPGLGKIEQMAQRRKSAVSRAELVTTAVKSIEVTSKKQLGKINSMRNAEERTLQVEREKVKAELEMVKTIDANAAGWADQALGIADHMKSIVRRESELQHQLLLKADEVAKDLEMRAKPIRKELPSILDFSEEDRVHLNLAMDKALNEVAKRRKEIEEDEVKLQRQMSVLIHNTPDPAAPKEQTISKLEIAYETIVLANDPDALRADVLANIARGESADKSVPASKTTGKTSTKSHSTKADPSKK